MLLSDFSLLLIEFVQWLAVVSLKTIPLIIVVLLVQRFFRKFLSASAKYLLWFTVLISLCAPFGWQLNVAPALTTANLTESLNPKYFRINASDNILLNQTNSISSVQESTSNRSLISSNTDIEHKITLEQSISKLDWRLVLAIFWLIGAFTFLSVTLTRAYQFHRIKLNSVPACQEILEILQACKLEMNVKKTIQLLTSNSIQSPVSLGWITPAIMLPKDLEHQLTQTKLKHILLHEVGHIKRQDIFFNWIACLVNIVHWFNPAVWLACRYMRKDMEMACDALVLSHLDKTQRKNYAATLIEISEIPRVSLRVPTTLSMFENHNELKQRLNMIKDFTTMNTKNSIFFGIILAVTAITSLAQPNTASNDKTTTSSLEKVSGIKSDDIELRNFAKFAENELKMKVLVGQNYAKTPVQVNMGESLDYGKFLTQLKINEFTAYKSKDYIQIIPLRDARSFSIPVVEKGKTYYEDEVVTDYLTTDKSCAAQVLATVRPLVPQYAHLSSDNGHTLIIIDTFGNIQRIRSAIKTLEANLDAPVDCKNIVPPPFRPNPAKQAENK